MVQWKAYPVGIQSENFSYSLIVFHQATLCHYYILETFKILSEIYHIFMTMLVIYIPLSSNFYATRIFAYS